MSLSKNKDIELLNQQETAKFLRVSESWLSKKRMNKEGLPYIKIGKKVYYDKNDLMGCLTSLKVKHKIN